MKFRRIVIDVDSTKVEFEHWKASIGTNDSPLGKLPLRLKQVVAHGPESEPEFPFELEYGM
jgi:hypothetical protein